MLSWRRSLLLVGISVVILARTTDATSTATKIHASMISGGAKDTETAEPPSFTNYTSTTTGTAHGEEQLAEEQPAPVAFFAKKKTTPTPSLKAAYHWYLKSCTEKPFLAKGLTSGTIAALGDVIAQKIEKSTAFSPKRVATFFFCNLLFTGPFIHMWYTFLNMVGNKMDDKFGTVTRLQKTVTQVLLDQSLGTFVFFPLYIYAYEIFDATIRWHRLPMWSKATEKCQKYLWGIIMTQYRVFPISNMINFGLVPYEMRVLFTSTVSLFWNIYLCSVVG